MLITQEQQEKLDKIGREHNIKLAMIIGSRTEKGKPKAELIIGYEMDYLEFKSRSFREYIDYKE